MSAPCFRSSEPHRFTAWDQARHNRASDGWRYAASVSRRALPWAGVWMAPVVGLVIAVLAIGGGR